MEPPRPSNSIVAIVVTTATVLLTACGGNDGAAGPDEWRAQIDTVGDTIVVRTLEGSEWGTARLVPEMRIGVLDGEEHEMLGSVTGLAVAPDGEVYFYDQQVPALRKFSADGEYLGTLGGEGGGPGEYANSDGGLVVLDDGRVVLRDPGNGRFTVYGPDGEYLEGWRTQSAAFTDIPLIRAGEGFLGHNFVQGTTGLVRYADNGAPLDTLPLPEHDVEPPILVAEGEGTTAMWPVPFMPMALWTFHPDGHFVTAVSDRYAIDLLREDEGVLRIEREVEPVPVAAGEREAQEERATRAMRRADPSWQWDGPATPSTKPLIRMMQAGEDGRLWVQLHQPAERVEDENAEPSPDGEAPIPEYREPVVYDVFEPDGRYLGRVEAPEGFSTSPRPIMRGDHVWATERDELDVQYVVRYRIERSRGGEG